MTQIDYLDGGGEAADIGEQHAVLVTVEPGPAVGGATTRMGARAALAKNRIAGPVPEGIVDLFQAPR